MCRLLGITNFDHARHGELIAGFLRLAEHGRVLKGDLSGHLDGWGIGWHEEGRARVQKSGGSLLKEREAFLDALRKIGRTRALILHLRKAAWKNSAVPEHAHPFAHKNVLFAHNGTVRDYQKLLDLLPTEDLPKMNALDTEVFFRFVMGGAAPAGLQAGFQKAVQYIVRNTEYSSLNCLFSDGSALYAFREYGAGADADYYSLYRTAAGESRIVASEPVTDGLAWEPMKKWEFCSL